MARFNFFERRNKNAAVKPRDVKDFPSALDIYAGQEATSFGAIDLISDNFAALSYSVFDKKTKKPVEHWLSELMDLPNIEETHSLFFGQIMKDYFEGNVYLYKYKNADGQVISLFRWNPDSVVVKRDPETNAKQFIYNGRVYYSDRVLHIPSKFGYDGLKGKSVFSTLKEIFDTSKNLDKFTSNTFNNNLGKRLVVDTNKAYDSLTEEQAELLEQRIIQNYSGVNNAGKPLIKKNGLEFSTIDTGTSSNQSAQLAENRMYQAKLVALVFHVCPEILGLSSLPADIEPLYTVLANEAIKPIASQFEEYFNLLLPPEERSRYYFEFNYNSILKVSLTRRVDAYAKQLTNGVLTVDEIRAKENLAELGTDAANTLLVPANLMPVRDDIFDAYMASAKEKLQNVNSGKNNVNDNDTTGVGDDKK